MHFVLVSLVFKVLAFYACPSQGQDSISSETQGYQQDINRRGLSPFAAMSSFSTGDSQSSTSLEDQGDVQRPISPVKQVPDMQRPMSPVNLDDIQKFKPQLGQPTLSEKKQKREQARQKALLKSAATKSTSRANNLDYLHSKYLSHRYDTSHQIHSRKKNEPFPKAPSLPNSLHSEIFSSQSRYSLVDQYGENLNPKSEAKYTEKSKRKNKEQPPQRECEESLEQLRRVIRLLHENQCEIMPEVHQKAESSKQAYERAQHAAGTAWRDFREWEDVASCRGSSLSTEDQQKWDEAGIEYDRKEEVQQEAGSKHNHNVKVFNERAKQAGEVNQSIAKMGMTCKTLNSFVTRYARRPCLRTAALVARLRRKGQRSKACARTLQKANAMDEEWRKEVKNKHGERPAHGYARLAYPFKRPADVIRKLLPTPFKSWEFHGYLKQPQKRQRTRERWRNEVYHRE